MAAGAGHGQQAGASSQVRAPAAAAIFGPGVTWVAGVASWVAGAAAVALLASLAVVWIWGEPANPSGGLQFSDAGSAADPPAATMTVTITLGGVDMALETVRDPTDPDTQQLIRGKETLSSFARDSFGNLMIDGQSVANDLRAAPAKVSVTSSHSVLRAAVHRAGPFRLGSGTIELDRDPALASRYRLVVNVRDYQILDVTSVDGTGQTSSPTELDQGSVAWDDSALPSSWKDIKIDVTYDPLAHPLVTLRRSPLDLVLLPWSLGLALLSAMLLAVPTIWALWLLPGHGRAGGRVARDAGRVLRGLLALSLAGSVLGLSLALAGPVAARGAQVLGHRGDGLMIPPVAAGVDPAAATLPWAVALTAALLVLAVLVAMGFRPDAGRPSWRAVPRLALTSVALAALLALVAEIASWAVFRMRLPYFTVPAAAIGAIVLALPLAWADRLYARWRTRARGLPWMLLTACILVAWAFLAVPASPVGYDLNPSKPDQAFRATAVFIPYLQGLNLAAYATAATIVLVLARMPGPVRATRVGWAMLLFAGYLVGLRASVLMVPLAFLVALCVFRRLVVLGDVEQQELDADHPAVVDDDCRQRLLKIALKREDATSDEERRLSNVVLAFAPHRTQWDNAARAMRYSLLLMVPLLLPSLLGFLSGAIGEDQPYFPLALVDQVITVVGYFLIGAFFFGYFFPYVRGNSGLTKGLYVSVGAIICLLPVWLLTTSSPQDVVAVLLRGAQLVIFFSALGAWFDYRTFRDTLRDFTLHEFLHFRGLGNVTAAGTVLIASVGAVMTTIFTGQLATVTSAAIRLVFPQLPVPPDAGPH